MTTATLTADPRSMSDDDLLAVFVADPDDDATRAAVLAEFGRRDRLGREAAEREQVRAEWHGQAYSDYLAAEQECRGELLSRDGERAGIRDGFQLWSGPRNLAEKYASEELREFWLEHPRVTVGEYRALRAAGQRAARQDALFGEQASGTTEDITTEITIETEGTDDELIIEAVAEAVADVAGYAPVRLRPGRAADSLRAGGAGSGNGTADQAGPDGHGRPVRPAGRVMLNFADVAPRDTLLLSRRPYLVYGDVALLFGSGALGKGRLTHSVIADVTNGAPVGLDETTDDDPGDVIVILPEDKREESAVKRMVAAGARLDRIWDLTRLPSGVRFKLSASPRDPGHLPELSAAVEQLRAAGRNPRLVVIDPIGACIGEGTIQTSKGARLFVERLQDFAEQCGVCVLLVGHPVSGGKLQGSWALEQALRIVYHVERDESDASLRVLRCVKGNDIAPELATDLRFTIADGPRGPRAVWVRPAQSAPGRTQAQPDWRDDLAARRQARTGRTAPPSPAGAGCKHPNTKLGTPRQCSDCPAARLSAPRAPQPAARPAPGTTYTAVVAIGAKTRILARGVGSRELAQAMCAATPEATALAAAGQPLGWHQHDAQTWQAGNKVCAFAVIAVEPARAAL